MARPVTTSGTIKGDSAYDLRMEAPRTLYLLRAITIVIATRREDNVADKPRMRLSCRPLANWGYWKSAWYQLKLNPLGGNERIPALLPANESESIVTRGKSMNTRTKAVKSFARAEAILEKVELLLTAPFSHPLK